jgi:lactoylglutathione lyase
MKYLHTMVRVSDLDKSLEFFCGLLGMVETRRTESEKGRYTNVFLAASEDEDVVRAEKTPALELTYNWDPEEYMAFIRTPDGISIEILQKDGSLPEQEPWASMENTGSW